MFQLIQANVYQFLTKGHERTLKAKKNILKSVVLKGGSVIISLVLVPLTINYIQPTQYGIWITLSSVIAWTAFFDIGLGNGLKNKLTTALSLGELTDAKSYVSTTYALLLAISIVLFVAFYVINPYIHWQGILNVSSTSYPGLSGLVLLLFGFFCLQFVVQLINIVLTANHEPSKTALLNLIGQALILVAILVLIRVRPASLADLVMVSAGIPVLVFIAASILLYRGNYSIIAPSFSSINFRYAKELLATGSAFFIIQGGALVLYETDNIVITQLFGPAQVTTFNVVFKLFSVVTMLFTIIITPFWAAFTEAYTKNDDRWIKSTMNKIHQLWIVLSILTCMLLLVSPLLYHLWLGKSISVPLVLSISMCLYTIVSIWQTIHVYLLNGVGKIRLQLYLVVLSAIVNIPLAILLGRYFGVAGVTLSNTVLFIAMGITFSVQANKIMNKTAKGVFNA